MELASLQRREDRLILEWLRLDHGDAPSSFDPDQLDWEWIYLRLADAAVLPLVYERLRSCEASPPDTLERMREFSVAAAMHWVTLQHSAETIIAALTEADVPVIALKGAALAPTVYRFPTLRLVGDLDLLLKEEHLDLATRLLRDMNYRQQELRLPPGHHHLPAFFDSLGHRVELHRHIVGDPLAEQIQVSTLFERARPFRLGKTRALMLAPEHLVVHACLHAALGHSFEGMLYQLCDIARIARRLSVDWDRLDREASDWEIETPLYWCLTAAQEMIGARTSPQLGQLAAATNVVARRFMEQTIPELLLGGRSWSSRRTYIAGKTCAQLLLTPSFTRAAFLVSRSVLSRKMRHSQSAEPPRRM